MDIQMNQSSGIFPKFFYKAVKNNGKSDEAGRPIYDKREMIEIHIAGDNKSVTVRKVHDGDRQRWRPQYEAFLAQEEAPLDGTPIDQWPALDVARAAELKALKIYTVEALADLRDSGIQRIGMGGRELVAKAVAYIKAAKDNSVVEKYAAENEKLHDEINMLKEQIKELSDAMDKPKRGRPPKESAA